MAKQLIVSVNGREKKIAIIEDDKIKKTCRFRNQW